MNELQIYGITLAIVVVSAVVLYLLDRRSKSEPIVWTDAVKIGGGAGTIAGGILYSMTTPDGAAVAEPLASAVQEMFVGKPEF
jgi:hypothetical protein